MKKWIPNFFYPHEFESIGEYLENQAAKGWILEQVGLYGFLFRKEAPTYRRYCIDLPAIGGLSRDRKEYMQEYIPMCQESGWEYVGTNGRIYVFSTKEESVIPLHTDSEVRYQAIDREWKPKIRTGLGLLLVMLWIWYDRYTGVYAQMLPRLSRAVYGGVLLLEAMIDAELLWAYFRWSKGQKQSAMTGDWRVTSGFRPVKIRVLLRILLGICVATWLGTEVWGLVQDGVSLANTRGLLKVLTSFPVILGLVCVFLYGLPAVFWKKGWSRERSGIVSLLIMIPVVFLWLGICSEGMERIQSAESGMTEAVAFLDKAPITCEELGLVGGDIVNYKQLEEGAYEQAGSYTVTWPDGRYLHYICEIYELEDTAATIRGNNDVYVQREMDQNSNEELRYEWIDKQLLIPKVDGASLYAQYNGSSDLVRYVYNMQKGKIRLALTYVAADPLTERQLQVIAEQLP